MGSPLSIVFLLVMLQALHVFCVRINRGRDTTSEEQNKTKAELHGQGTEVIPMRNAPAAVKEEGSRRPPGMAVEEDDKRLSHDTGNNTTNTTLLYPPAQHHGTGNTITNTKLLYPPTQHHSDSSNAPETRKPAALTDQRLKKLEDWSGNLTDESSMTSDGKDTGRERGRSGKLFDESSMTSDGKDTGRESRGRSGKLSDKSSMTSDGRDTGEKSWSDNPSDKSSMTSDGKDTGQERGRSGKLSDKSSMISDGRDTGQEKSWSENPSDKSSMTSDGKDTRRERGKSGKLFDTSFMTSDGIDTGQLRGRSRNPSDKSSMTSDGIDTGQLRGRSRNPSVKSSMTPDDKDTGQDRGTSGKLSDTSSITSYGRDTGEKSWSGNPSDKSSMTPNGRNTGEERSRLRNPSDKSFMKSDGRDTGEDKSRSRNPSDKSSMTPDGRDTGEKRSWSYSTSQKALTTSLPELEATREVTKQHHWQDAPHDSTSTAWREEDARQRTGRLKTMSRDERMEWLKTMNHNERMERLKTMHLNVSSARRDDKAERGGMTKRNREHPQRKMRRATYGDDEITAYYANYTCACPRCKKPAKKGNLAQIVYKKPSYASSHADNTAGACGMNNGDSGTVLKEYPLPNGFLSRSNDKRAWWYCDLDDLFTITTVYFVFRGSGTTPGSVGRNCPSPIRGRYVRLQKDNDSRHSSDVWHILEIQELLIFACLPGYYFNLQQRKCVSCESPCKYICDNKYGCNSILKYNVVAKFTGVEMSPLNVGTVAGTTNLVKRSARSSDDARECAATGTRSGQNYHRFWKAARADSFLVFHFYVTPTEFFQRDRMTNLKFLVMRHETNLGTAYNAGPTELCKNFTGSLLNARQKVTCDRPLVGSILAIQGPPSSSLSLCQVEVIGYRVDEIKAGKTGCDSELETTFCGPGLVCEYGVCKITLGGNCAGRILRTSCDNQTTCDRGTCKLNVHKNCRGNSDMCKIDTECDPSNKKCKIKTGGLCQTANECSQSENNTCDFLSECRVKTGKACFRNSDCAAGAMCISSKCQCNTTISQPSNDMCLPAEGYAGSICGNSTSTIACITQTSCTSNICQCEDGYEIFPRTFTCTRSKRVDSNCTILPCTSGLICEENKCKLDVRERCKKISDCRASAQCDDITSSCRIKVGGRCTDSGECGMDATCHAGSCRLQFGEACNASDDKCTALTKCSTNAENTAPLCLLELGQSCFGDNKIMCVDGTVCDKDSICRTPPGAQCSTINGEYCVWGTQCNGGSCRLIMGATCQTNGIQCLPGLVCDSLGQCRIPADGSCSERPRGCLAGANCNSDKCECQTDNCIPSSGKIGSVCTVTEEDPQGKETCSDPFAICDSNIGVCQCSGDFETVRANFTCAKGSGSYCNTTFPCPLGLVCDYGNICAIDAGDSCEGRKIRFCRRDTICDIDSLCRWTAGADCRSRKDMCLIGQICDSSGVCKIPLNKECNYNEACEAGTNCDGNTSLCTCTEGIARPTTQGDSCEPSPGRVGGDCSPPQCLDPNSVCNNQICECSPGFSVNYEDFTCSKDLGESCENDEECGPSASCDSGKECSLLLGQSCRGKLKEHCGQDAVCDKNDECKIKSQGTCDRNAFLPCEVGRFCDWLGVCRQEETGSCDVTSLCAAGAVCVNKSCQCDKDISVAFDVVCKPANGRVGADCNDVNLKCTTAGAKCVGAVCICADGVKTTSEFGCSGVSEKKETPNSSVSMLGLIVGVAVSTLLLSCCLGFVIFKRSKKSKEKVQALKAERAKVMADISALAYGATPDGKAIQADPASQSAGNAKQADPASQLADNAKQAEPASQPTDNAKQAEPASQPTDSAKQADPALQSADSAIEGETPVAVEEESVDVLDDEDGSDD
ncbi:uncharacterized protein [Littorina saxatilis]|uniref:uncharacterized protein isoform X2 n=1 Tax=Littorina saxatilis TaxID=31220 RepID=UPI0038B42A01